MSEQAQILKEIQSVKEIVIRMEEAQKATRNIVDAHSDVIWDGKGSTGLSTRVDRIEQSQDARKKVAVTAFSVLGLIGLKPLWDLLKLALGNHS